MKAFAYLRVSKIRQELSPEVQRAQLEAYCAVKGYELIHIFDEPAICGGTILRERPEGAWLMAMLDECDTVIFTKLDRAFRDVPDCIMTATDIMSRGKSVHFLDLGIDTSTAAGEMCMTMLAAMARFERRRISERITETLAIVKAQGRKIGPAGFGFRNLARIVDGHKVDAGRHESVESESKIVARIGVMYQARKHSLREIAAALNDEQIPAPRGGVWRASSVAKIVGRMA